MATKLSPTARARAIRGIDLVTAVWVVAWVVIGFFVGLNMYELRQLADTTDAAAQALEETAQGLESVSGIPVIGEQLGEIAADIEDTAASARVSADRSRDNVADLAWLLGIVVVVIPAVPALSVWLPYRLQRRREVQAVERALADDGDLVDEYLAHRALANLPYHSLREVTEHPWRDLHDGRFRALADAELERLGVQRPESS